MANLVTTKDDVETAKLVVELNDSMGVETPDFVRKIATADPKSTPSAVRAHINGWQAPAEKELPILASTQLADQLESESVDVQDGETRNGLRPILVTEDVYQMVTSDGLRYLTDADGDVQAVRVVGTRPDDDGDHDGDGAQGAGPLS